jgi:hypothetical protein
MLKQILVAGLLTLVTTAIHGGCTAATIRTLTGVHAAHWAMRSLARKVAVIATLVIVMLGASLLEAWLWSLAYLSVGAIEGAESALYFSIVTFTTLGYGDIVLAEGWRLLASLQAATGIVIFGWTTALLIAVMQRIIADSG